MKRIKEFSESSPTYHMIIDLLYNTKSINMKQYSKSWDGNTYKRQDASTTLGVQQEIVVGDINIYSMCTPAMWSIVGRIMNELKHYNVLWECPPELKINGTSKKALRELIKMKLLIATEVTNIYIVNPLYLRRGDFYGVLATTANMIREHGRLDNRLITNKRAISEFKLIGAGIVPAP